MSSLGCNRVTWELRVKSWPRFGWSSNTPEHCRLLPDERRTNMDEAQCVPPATSVMLGLRVQHRITLCVHLTPTVSLLGIRA